MENTLRLSSEVASHSPTLPGSEAVVKHQLPLYAHNDACACYVD